MDKLFIPVIQGTVRPKRRSFNVAKLVHKVASELPEVESQLLDPNDFNMPFDGNDEETKDPRYSEISARADAFFLIISEYNHGYPGTLKRFMDSELKNYVHKPVAFAGVSNGPWGGVRAIEAFVPSAREMGLAVCFTDVNFPFVSKLFDDDGNLTDDAYIPRIEKAYKELIWMAKTFKWGRENLPQES